VGVNEAAQLADGRTAAMGPRVGAAQERGEPETEELQGIYALERAAAKLPRAEPPEVPRAAAIGEGDEFWEEFPGFTGAFEAGHLWDHPEDWEAEFMEAGVNMTAAVRRWVWEGYSVYIDKSKLGASPRAYKLTPEEEEWAARKVIGEQIPAGSVEEVARDELPRGAVVCNVVVAYKNGEMSRLCWSGKPMNRASDKQKFRMESWLEILQLAEPGDWMFSLDFEKGYQQVPLKAAFKNFTLFALRGKTYRHRVLPFGLSSGPKDFSQIVRKVLAILRKRGVRCAFYIDDLIFFARSRDEARRLRGEVLRLLHRLNLRVSVRKSLLEPGQRIEHLGFELCTASMAVYVPAQKVVRYKRLAEAVLQHCRQPRPGREVARVIGKLQSFRLAMPATLIATRGLARCLQQLPLREDAAAAQRGDRIEWRDYEGTVQLSQLAIAELRFWDKCIWHLRGTRFQRPLRAVAFVDACPGGYGAVWTEVQRTPAGLDAARTLQVHELRGGAWLERYDAHSCEFELANLVQEVVAKGEAWQSTRVHVCTDNVGAAHIVGKGCMKNARLHALSLQLWAACMRWDVALTTQYLCGDGIISSGADGLSRGEDVYDCMLTEAAMRRLWDWKGPFEVDCFAAPTARQRGFGRDAMTFVSPYGGGAIWTDALTLRHTGALYAFPPALLVGKWLTHVRRTGLRAVTVVPVWPTSAWWSVAEQCERVELGAVADRVTARPAMGGGAPGVPHPFGRSFDVQAALQTPLAGIAMNM